MDYDPSVEAYRNQITDLLNDAYYRLFSEKPFTFAQKEEIVVARGDISTDANAAILGATSITFPIASIDAEDYWEGQIIEIDGTEYTIAWKQNNLTIYLTTPLKAAFAGGAITVKFRYLDMPQDCNFRS